MFPKCLEHVVCFLFYLIMSCETNLFLVVCTVNCDTIFGWRSNVPLSTRSLFRLLRLHRPHFLLPNQAVAFQSNRHGDTCGQETQFQVITVHNCLDIRDLLQEVFSSSPSIKTAPVQRKLKMWLTAALIAQRKGDRGQIIWQYCSPGAFLFFHFSSPALL